MSIKIKDKVICQVETKKSGKKAIFARKLLATEIKPELEEKEFEIIAIELPYTGADYYIYTIVLDDDMIGWIVSSFMVKHLGIDSKFTGKKFYDLTEDYFTINTVPKLNI